MRAALEANKKLAAATTTTTTYSYFRLKRQKNLFHPSFPKSDSLSRGGKRGRIIVVQAAVLLL